jgi:hypothetical protein
MVNALTFTSGPNQTIESGHDALWTLVSAIRQNPAFDAECVLYANERTEALLMRPYLSKITSTESRYVPMRGALSAYYAKIAQTGEEGLTLSDVHQASLEGCDLGSRNRVTGLINALQSVGIVKVETSPFDRRERILRLTETGNLVLERIRRSSVDRVVSLLGIQLGEVGSDDYYSDLARYYARGFSLANSEYRLSSMFPEYATFFDRTFGLELLNLLFIAASKSGSPKLGNISFSYSKMSERFDISRAQMRQLVVHCQEVGLINVHGLGGRETEITDKFLELYRNIVATSLAITALSIMTDEQAAAFMAADEAAARKLA